MVATVGVAEGSDSPKKKGLPTRVGSPLLYEDFIVGAAGGGGRAEADQRMTTKDFIVR